MSIDEIVEQQITDKIKARVDEVLSPIVVLKDFDGVDVLTFEETAGVLRLTFEELENAIKSNSVPCVKTGKARSTWRFPKRLLVDLLLGDWSKRNLGLKK